MNILGIDYSLNGTGLSIYNTKFIKVFTSVKKDYESNTEVFILSPKFKNIYEKMDWVCDTIINCTDYDFACMEDHIGSYYNWMDGYAIIKHYLRKNSIPYLMVSPTQLKKYAGSGKANKDQMGYFLDHEYHLNYDFIGKLANNVVDATWLSILGRDFVSSFIDKKQIKNGSVERFKILSDLYKKWEFADDTN